MLVLNPAVEDPVYALEQKRGKRSMVVFVEAKQLSSRPAIQRNVPVRNHTYTLTII